MISQERGCCCFPENFPCLLHCMFVGLDGQLMACLWWIRGSNTQQTDPLKVRAAHRLPYAGALAKLATPRDRPTATVFRTQTTVCFVGWGWYRPQGGGEGGGGGEKKGRKHFKRGEKPTMIHSSDALSSPSEAKCPFVHPSWCAQTYSIDNVILSFIESCYSSL